MQCIFCLERNKMRLSSINNPSFKSLYVKYFELSLFVETKVVDIGLIGLNKFSV